MASDSAMYKYYLMTGYSAHSGFGLPEDLFGYADGVTGTVQYIGKVVQDDKAV